MKMVRMRYKREDVSVVFCLGNVAGGSSLKVTDVVMAGEKEEWSGLTSSAVRV